MLETVLAFLFALLVGSLVEYWAHRLMHLRWVLGRRHAEHHRVGTGQGVLGEFRDYLGAMPVMGWLGFLYSIRAGIAFAVGAVLFAFFAAYSHQVNHERPELSFWMRRPLHHQHHVHKLWFHNFAISVDIWDRVFGTYKDLAWQPARRPFDHPLSAFFKVKWL